MRTVPQGRLSVDSLGVTIRRQDGTKEPVALLPSDQSSQPWDWTALFNPLKNFWDALVGPGLAPQYGVMMWPYDLAVRPVPEGWLLCDGTHGTQNLEGMFIVGATAGADGGKNNDLIPEYKVGEKGGKDWIGYDSTGASGNVSQLLMVPDVNSDFYGVDSGTTQNVLKAKASYVVLGNDLDVLIPGSPDEQILAADSRPRYFATHFIQKA